jgi:glycosidase
MERWMDILLLLGCLALVLAAWTAADTAYAGPPSGPAWARNLPVYETSLDLATPTGKFREFEERVDALKDLGIGIVWFLPVFPRSGNPSDKPPSDSPYCVRDYYEVNPRHGTKEEFRHLVDAIHARGMYAIMDWVPNHTSWGNDLIKTHPEFYKKGPDGRIVHPEPWKDVAQLDYANRELWEYMYQARKYWITQFGVDGFREDVAEAVPLEHWQWLRPKLDALKPVFMLAEADTPRLHPAFDMTYDWTSQVFFYMVARGTWPASSLDRMLDDESLKFPAGAIRMRHLTNHDMSYMQYAWDNRAHLDKNEYEFLEKVPLKEKYKGGDRAFAVLCATLPRGKPMIWNGQELGILAGTPKLKWEDNPYVAFYRALLHAYRRNPAMVEGDFVRIATSRPDAVYAFRRQAGENRVVVAVNLTDKAQQAALEVGGAAGAYTELFAAQGKTLAARENLDLEPWAYRVYVSGTPREGEKNTDWLRNAGYGVFMHFLPGDAKGLALMDKFDVEALARQLESLGAKYFVITLGQNSGYFNSPNAAYGRFTGYAPGERCSSRDLPLDLYRALHARGIKLMLYLPCQTPNADRRAQKAFGLREGPADQPIDVPFARKWAEVIQEWSGRYGDKVAGWWFDGGYKHVGFNEAMARLYADAVKHGNPNAIVTFNPGVQLVRHTQAEDYTAGELNDPFDVVPASRWVAGSQWHALTFLGSTWSHRDVRHPTERWSRWVSSVVAKEGVVTLDMGPNWDSQAGPIGALAEAQMAQVKAIKAAVESIRNHRE